MTLYCSTSKQSLAPLKSYTEISRGPVEPTLQITSGPVQLKVGLSGHVTFAVVLFQQRFLNKFWFLNDSHSDAFPTARTLFQIYYCYPTDRWMIGFLYFDRSWVNWPFGPCLLQFFQLFVNLRLLNAQLLRNLDSLGSFASCWTIFRSLDL